MQIFAMQMFFYDVLKLLDVDVLLFAAFQLQDERNKVVDFFIVNFKTAMILIDTYACANIDLNFQHNCWHVHIFEHFNNDEIITQFIERIKRLKNLNSIVYVNEFFVKKTFNDRQITVNIQKAIFDVMTELNKRLFYEIENFNDDARTKLNDYIYYNEKIVSAKSMSNYKNFELSLLSFKNFLKWILRDQKSAKLQMKWRDAVCILNTYYQCIYQDIWFNWKKTSICK